MMKRKLTLTIDERVVKTAKAYASRADKSVSELVEASLDGLDYDFPIEKGLSAKLGKIAGAVKLPADFDERVELQGYLEGKHR
jgi:hypothetical protein